MYMFRVNTKMIEMLLYLISLSNSTEILYIHSSFYANWCL